jgi:hypothetical protein
MRWVLVAISAVALWLVVAGVVAALGSRRRLRRTPGLFVCRLRPAGPAERSGWSRAKRHAYWVHDVLLVHRGPSLRRYDALPVANVAGPVGAATVKGLGAQPMMLRLHLDDGRLIDLAASNANVTPATGPFLAASMNR